MRRPEATRHAPTLGDVLYAGDTGALVEEAQWVALLRAIAAGEPRALRTLFESTQALVFEFIARAVTSQATAERLTVEVFYDVWRYAASYDPAVGSVLGWIMSQARSKAIDQLRIAQRNEPRADRNRDTGTT